MHSNGFLAGVAVVLASVSTAAGIFVPASTGQTDFLAGKGLLNVAISQILGHRQSNCSLTNAAVRREW
jgi:hypothetical protein